MLALANSASRVRKFHKERTFIVFLVILLVGVRHLRQSCRAIHCGNNEVNFKLQPS